MAVPRKAATELAASYAAAWSSQDAGLVASHYEPDAQVATNHGDVHKGTAAITELAAGFHAAFPDMKLACDNFRLSGNHALFAWTFYGHHTDTKKFVKLSGWEEWELSDEAKIRSSLIWFDQNEYNAQVAGKKGN